MKKQNEIPGTPNRRQAAGVAAVYEAPEEHGLFGAELLRRTIANAPPNELSIRRLRGGA